MDKAEGKQAPNQEPDDSAAKANSSAKEMPDLAKLGKSRPTKIPRTAKEPEQLVPRPKVNWRRFSLFPSILTLLIILVYAVTILGGAVLNDTSNIHYVSSGLINADFWPRLWATAIAHPMSQSWVTATYAWDVTSLSWTAEWSHAVNICLHLLTCLYLYALVFRICWRLKNDGAITGDPYFTAFAVSALFAMHPLVTGTVSYISGRAGSLVALNYFISLNIFLIGFASESNIIALCSYVACFGFMAVGLLCDARAITIPISIVVLGMLLKPQNQQWKDWFENRGYELIVFVFAALAMPLTIIMGGDPAAPKLGVGLPILSQPEFLATQLKSVVSYYLRCVLVPFGLSVEPPFVVAKTISDPLAVAGAATLIAGAVVAYIYRRIPLVCFGLSLFALGMLPTIFLVQPEYTSDQRYYLSLAGLCMVGGWALGQMYLRNRRHTVAATAGLLLALGGLNIWRSLEWRSENALWKQAIAVNPRSIRAHILYAQSLQAANKIDQAAKEADLALKMEPDNAIAMQISAQAKIEKKDYQAALPLLEKAIELTTKAKEPASEIAPLQRDLSVTYASMNKLDEAWVWAKKAQIGLPDDSTLHLIIGKELLRQKKYREALLQLAPGLNQDPGNNEFYAPVAQAALDSGIAAWRKYAFPAAQRAFQVTKTRDNALLFGRAALADGKPAMALRAVSKYSGEKSDDAECTFVAAIALQQTGDSAKAAAVLARALAKDPDVAKKVKIILAPSIPVSNIRGRGVGVGPKPPTSPASTR